MLAYAENQGINLGGIRFFFDGDRINEGQSPISVSIDIISSRRTLITAA